jgi:cytochrome oxidase Cu insertion factor (SCO1/SenC/PrrC family)
MKQNIFLVTISILLVFVAGCSSANLSDDSLSNEENNGNSVAEKLYAADRQRVFVGKELMGYQFTDVLSDTEFTLDELKGKPTVLVSFFVSCPSCADGIKKFRTAHNQFGDDVNIIYVDVNPDDTEQDIIDIKKKYNGGAWLWVKYNKEFLDEFGITGSDIIYITDKEGIIRDAYSYKPPIERIVKKVEELL